MLHGTFTKSNQPNPLKMNQREAARGTLSPGLTAIIPTYNCNPRTFAVSLLSLLCHSSPTTLEHVIVSINGPDQRTGDTSNQDVKQKFLEAIRNERIGSRDMPLTVMRTWSRLGHGQAVDAALNWVHTDKYLLMHDDVFILSKQWAEVSDLLMDQEIGWVFADQDMVMESPRITHTSHNGENLSGIVFPHPTTHFVALRTCDTLGIKWAGGFVTKDKFATNITTDDLPTNTPDFLSYDIGTFVMHHLKSMGLKGIRLPDCMYHYIAASWSNAPKSPGELRLLNQSILNTEKRTKRLYPNIFNIYHEFFGKCNITPHAIQSTASTNHCSCARI